MECEALEGPRSGAVYSQMRSFRLGESVVSSLLKSSTEAASWAITFLAQSALLRDCCQSVQAMARQGGGGV